MPRNEIDPSLIIDEPHKRKLASYVTNKDNISAVDCPRSGPGPVRALFADPGPRPQVQVQSFSDLDLDMSTAVY